MGCSSSRLGAGNADVGEAAQKEEHSLDRRESAPSHRSGGSSWSSRSSAQSAWSGSGADGETISTFGSAGPQNVPSEMELAKSRLKQIASNPAAMMSPIKTVHMRRKVTLQRSPEEDRKDGDSDDNDEDEAEAERVPSEEEIRRAEEILRLAAQYFNPQSEQLSVENDDGWTTGSDSDSDIVEVEDEEEDVADEGIAVEVTIDESIKLVWSEKGETNQSQTTATHTKSNNNKPINYIDVDLVESRATQRKQENQAVCEAWEDEDGKKVWLDHHSPVPSKRKISDYYHGADPRGPTSPFLVKRGVIKSPVKKADERKVTSVSCSRLKISAEDDSSAVADESDAQSWLSASLSERKRRRRRRMAESLDISISTATSQSLSSSLSSWSSSHSVSCAADEESLLTTSFHEESTLSDLCDKLMLPDVARRRKHKHKKQSVEEKEAKRLKKEKKRQKKAAKKDKKKEKKRRREAVDTSEDGENEVEVRLFDEKWRSDAAQHAGAPTSVMSPDSNSGSRKSKKKKGKKSKKMDSAKSKKTKGTKKSKSGGASTGPTL